MKQKFTHGEVVRMMGVSQRQLDYWGRIGLMSPRARWGENFYDFSDLVSIETIKRLTSKGVPARKLQRALDALRQKMGETTAPLSRLRISTNGRQVVVAQPFPGNSHFEPLTGQMVLAFETSTIAEKVRSLPSRSAEEWFEIGLASDTRPSTMRRAADAYRHAVERAPEWVEAHLNLGTALFHLGDLPQARACFESALELEPQHALAHFNLGCVLERLGNRDAAMEQLERAVRLAPTLADAHLNLALLYDAVGRKDRM
ncbi:MAG: tetratricopeptide repeat protein, partial [Bryobacteraceae bacterium]